MSETIPHRRLQLMPGAALIVGTTVLLAAVAIFDGWFSVESTGRQRQLTQPLRLVVESDNGHTEFGLALRVHHYRMKLRDEAEYRDIFYDTPEWDLFRNGYSYRFRTGSGPDGLPKYSVRLEQEPRFVPNDSAKLDQSRKLPTALGEAIANGEWERAISLEGELVAPAQLHSVLAKLGKIPGQLEPQLIGELRRSRFDVTDKGRNWFELDRELWAFHEFRQPSGPGVTYEDIVIDTRLQRQDPELLRRVQTMSELVKIVNGVRPAVYVPHERAIQQLK